MWSFLGQKTSSSQKTTPRNPFLVPKRAIWAQESKNTKRGWGFIFEYFESILKVQL